MRLIAATVTLLMSLITFADENTSAVWSQYLSQKQSGQPTCLPDFSYAGYRQGSRLPEAAVSKVFNVTDFGAYPDDMLDDMEGIAKAVKAAEHNGGGIVFLPRGRYLVNTDMNKRGTIKITSDNIVIRGEGNSKGGTIIHAIHPYGGGDPHRLGRLHLGENVFLVHSQVEERSVNSRETIASVVTDSASGSFSVSVDSSDRLKPGQNVLLYALNKDIFKSMVEPYSIDLKWTTITGNKAPAIEIHRIAKISGNTVYFAEPILYNVKAVHGWTLKDFKPVSGVGFENICFMGNAYHDYYHHRSGYDDSGWAFIKMKGVTESWVRNCSFINCSQTTYVALSSYVSMLNIFIDGNKGHHIPRSVFFNYGVFGGLMLDRAGYDHGPSVSWGCVGTVFWRCASKGSLDSHAGRPFASLYDNLRGGRINSSGGTRDYPQHLRNLIVWNFYNTDKTNFHYDFWVEGKNNCFVKPVLVGFHGEPATFNKDSLEVFESYGKPVQPESLYEAQLALRLGRTPAWIEQLRKEHKKLAALPVADHFDRSNPDSKPFIYPEKFKAEDMLKYLCSLSLQMFRSVQFEYKVDDGVPAMITDQGLLRNTLYSLMNCIYKHGKKGNTIRVWASDDGRVHFIVSSGKLRRPSGDLSNNSYVSTARLYASFIGGELKDKSNSDAIVFDFSIPVVYNNLGHQEK
ncbi:MAG: DUF4955 domain-containing protein [Victivallales bacterium]|nr:DUF4955 domain-containing protein [Victivallales bacterium]